MTIILVPLLLSMAAAPDVGQQELPYQQDTIRTSAGDLQIAFFGHASLLFRFGGKAFYLDPVSRYADYKTLPKADCVLVTHAHADHFDPGAIAEVTGRSTVIVGTTMCADKLSTVTVMRNGDVRTIDGVTVEAVPAYNLVHKRENGSLFHPKGEGNGYVLTFGKTRVYVAGDTENTPEMKALRNIAIAFLPMNLPYTMTPEMVADAARAFRPSILYPYHYGTTDPEKLVTLLRGEQGIEVRVRNLR
jgi:L-ascorbate metabolism protein UlaG (beta-lactamase superfamily)